MMSDAVKEEKFNTNQKIHIKKIIFKDKDGNIIGERNNEHKGYKTR